MDHIQRDFDKFNKCLFKCGLLMHSHECIKTMYVKELLREQSFNAAL